MDIELVKKIVNSIYEHVDFKTEEALDMALEAHIRIMLLSEFLVNQGVCDGEALKLVISENVVENVKKSLEKELEAEGLGKNFTK